MSEKPESSSPSKDALLGEMEQMLHEQLTIQPGDIKLHVRLARLYADRGDRDAFIGQVSTLKTLLSEDHDDKVLVDIQELARVLKIDPEHLGSKGRRPQRRLGEDPASRRYFDTIAQAWEQHGNNGFSTELDRRLIRACHRPTPLMPLKRFTQANGGAQIALKREDMLGPGAKLAMIVQGQVLMAKKIGYQTVVCGSAKTQTGVHMAAAAAQLGLRAVVFVDERDARIQASDVLKMRAIGAQVELTDSKTTPRDAAMDRCAETRGHFLILGVEGSPAPFDQIHHELLNTIGREVRAQCQGEYKRQPDLLVARGSKSADAFGLFDPFMERAETRLVCVETQDSLEAVSSNDDRDPFKRHTQLLTDEQRMQADVILEGSEFPSVRREHKRYRDSGRVEYQPGSILDARSVIKAMARSEGLLLPIRSAFAVGWAARVARDMAPDKLVVIGLVEPSDKDLRDIAEVLGISR